VAFWPLPRPHPDVGRPGAGPLATSPVPPQAAAASESHPSNTARPTLGWRPNSLKCTTWLLPLEPTTHGAGPPAGAPRNETGEGRARARGAAREGRGVVGPYGPGPLARDETARGRSSGETRSQSACGVTTPRAPGSSLAPGAARLPGEGPLPPS